MTTSIASTTNALNAATSTASGSAGSSALTSATPAASQANFLTLLVAQLKNQDPMNPMDNAQMTSQMAQINTVSGIQQVNTTLQGISTQFTSMQVLQGANMVGHQVLVDSNTLSINAGTAGGAINLAGNTDNVKVDILSPTGQVVDSLNLGALSAGQHSFTWNASAYTGTGAPSFAVTATLGGQAITSTSMALDQVVSVGSTSGVMTVQLQGRSAVPYSSIKSIL